MGSFITKLTMQISASKLKTFEECARKFKYCYVDKLPKTPHDYFEIGKHVEEILRSLIQHEAVKSWYTLEEIKMANALYGDNSFRSLIDWKELTYQYKIDTPDIIGYTDIETPEDVIDIKTSASNWTQETVKEYMYQAMIYARERKKNMVFVVLNKKSLRVQIIRVPIKSFLPLEEKIIELKLMLELGWQWDKNPTWKCKFCDYNLTCKSDN